MAALALWFANLSATALSYFGYQVATRTAFYLAASIATVAIFVALAATCTALITGTLAALSSNVLVQGIGLFLPWNASLCVSAYVSASFANWMAKIGITHVMLAARA